MLQNLEHRTPVVNPDGTPTDYFIRLLQGRGGLLEDAGDQIDLLNAAIAALLARQIIAGVGLDGGGTLAADITIDANASAILDTISSTRGVLLYRGAAANLPPKLPGEAVLYPEDEESWFGRKIVARTLWYILTRPVQRTKLLIDMLSGIEANVNLVAPDAEYFPANAGEIMRGKLWVLPEVADFDPADWPNIQAFRSRLKPFSPLAQCRVKVGGKEVAPEGKAEGRQ